MRRLALNSETFLALLLMFVPIIPYSHLLFDAQLDSFYLFGENYHHGYVSNQVFVWSLTNDLANICLTIIIYKLIDKRWKIFLIPITTFYIISTYSIITDQDLGQILSSYAGIIMAIICLEIMMFESQNFRFNMRKHVWIFSIRGLLSSSNKKFLQWNQQVNVFVHSNRKVLDSKNELCRIYYLSKLVEDKSVFGFKRKTVRTNKLESQKEYRCFGVILALAFLMNFIYLPFPPEQESFSVLGLEFHSFGFEDYRTFLWYLFRKIGILIILISALIKGISSWPKYSILPTLVIHAWHYLELLLNSEYIDESRSLRLIIILIFILLFLVLIMRYVRYRDIIISKLDLLKSRFDSVLLNISNKN